MSVAQLNIYPTSISVEDIKSTSDALRQTIALRRKELRSIVFNTPSPPQNQSPLPIKDENLAHAVEGVEPMKIVSTEALDTISRIDDTILSDESSGDESIDNTYKLLTVPFGENLAELEEKMNIDEIFIDIPLNLPSIEETNNIKNIKTTSLPIKDPADILLDENSLGLYTKINTIRESLGDAFPSLLYMDRSVTNEILANMVTQEVNWDSLTPSDIIVNKNEMTMWHGFLKDSKEVDFLAQKKVELLHSGEIIDLHIDGFEKFQVVRIRSKNKYGFALAVIEFIQKGDDGIENMPHRGNFFIELPIVVGKKCILLRKGDMKMITSYHVKNITINKRQRSIVQDFFDIFL